MYIYIAYDIDNNPIGYYRNLKDAVNDLYQYMLEDENAYDFYWVKFLDDEDTPIEYYDIARMDATDEMINAYNEWLFKFCDIAYYRAKYNHIKGVKLK